MGNLKPGFFNSRYFTKNYWQSKFPYFTGYFTKSRALLLPKEKKPKFFKYSSRLELCIKILSKTKLIKYIDGINICIESSYSFIKANREDIELFLIDDDLWLSEL